jgi:hydroxymethylpyrimidine kinase/phosphomethylpyrimidine kinase
MRKRQRLPVALTIAGSDSGGGAGIQADLKAFAAIGVHGTSAVTCLTAQNPRGVRSVQNCRPAVLKDQLEAVFDALPPAAVKTGMLASTALVRVVVEVLRERACRIPVIVDPVMVATSGARLLSSAAARVLTDELLPLATLMTPNLDEAAALLRRPITEPEDLREAARVLRDRHGCAVLVKGGHLADLREAVDLFWDGEQELLLSAPRVTGVGTHGTGCTYSAAIAAYVALGLSLPQAVEMAKNHVTQAIVQSIRAGDHDVLQHFWDG